MRFSPPTNPLSTELAKLTIRLYDALRQAGVSVQMVCSRTPSGFFGPSRSKYLRINGREATLRISDHSLPRHHDNTDCDFEVIVRNVNMIEAAELRAKQWIDETYGSSQIQKAAS